MSASLFVAIGAGVAVLTGIGAGLGNRAYIITHSLKKMKKEDREIALNPTQFRKVGSTKFIDLRTLDETDEEIYNTVYYKEVPVVTGNMDETLIVTYSPKYKAYQYWKYEGY